MKADKRDKKTREVWNKRNKLLEKMKGIIEEGRQVQRKMDELHNEKHRILERITTLRTRINSMLLASILGGGKIEWTARGAIINGVEYLNGINY